jgi:hypothetical protein
MKTTDYFINKLIKLCFNKLNVVKIYKDMYIELWYGCRWEQCELNNSNKIAYRCSSCGRWSTIPIKAIYSPCPEKIVDMKVSNDHD